MENPMVSPQTQTAPQPRVPSGSANASQHASWIAGRIETLLSHYFQPDAPSEIKEAAFDDWVEALWPFARKSIDAACKVYLRDQPRRRPTPGEIRNRAEGQERLAREADATDGLSVDEEAVADFAVSRGWMAFNHAEREIKAGRNADVPKWIVSEKDRALYACRHSEFNRKMKNGHPVQSEGF